MSRKLVTLVYERRIGSLLRKAVLAYMADRANDNGTGVWVSKGRIAREIEASRSGVITAIKQMVEDGLLIDNGILNGRSTHDYTLNLPAIRQLPMAQDDEQGCPDLDTPPVQKTTPPVYPVDTPCLPGGHEPSLNSPLNYGADGERRAAEAQARSAMKAQGLASQMGQEILEALRDLQKRGKASLREIDSFKGAVRGVADGQLVLSPSYDPPEAVAAIINRPKLKLVQGDHHEG